MRSASASPLHGGGGARGPGEPPRARAESKYAVLDGLPGVTLWPGDGTGAAIPAPVAREPGAAALEAKELELRRHWDAVVGCMSEFGRPERRSAEPDAGLVELSLGLAATLERLDQRASGAARERDELGARLAERALALARAKRRLEELGARLEERARAERRLEELTASRSWRLTAPLRAIRKRMRRG